MRTSQNGWPVLSGYSDPKLVKIPFITGKVLGGDTAWIFTDFVTWFHKNVEPLDIGVADDWGFAPRPIKGTTVISNHASGTAIDINAMKYPMFVDRMNAQTEALIRARLKRYRGAIRWGGDYRTGRIDQMHFEINCNASRLKEIVAELKGSPAKPSTPKPPSKPAATKPSAEYTAWVKALQTELNLWKSDLPRLTEDGVWGARTEARLKEWQRRNMHGVYKGTLADGIAGPLTIKPLGIKPMPKK